MLLMVFALSITPKKFLHNAFAKHSDKGCTKESDKPYQVTTSGYNCNDNNQVAESVFVNVLHSVNILFSFSFPSYISKNTSFFSTTAIYSHLRGPPVNI